MTITDKVEVKCDICRKVKNYLSRAEFRQKGGVVFENYDVETCVCPTCVEIIIKQTTQNKD